jgi:hypothetical protein
MALLGWYGSDVAMVAGKSHAPVWRDLWARRGMLAGRGKRRQHGAGSRPEGPARAPSSIDPLAFL